MSVFAIPLSVSKVKDPKNGRVRAVSQQEGCVRAMYFGSDRVIAVHVPAPDGKGEGEAELDGFRKGKRDAVNWKAEIIGTIRLHGERCAVEGSGASVRQLTVSGKENGIRSMDRL